MNCLVNWIEKYKSLWAAAAVSLLAAAGFSFMVKGENALYTISNSIFSVLAFFICWKLYRSDRKIPGIRIRILSAVISFLFSCFMVIGSGLLSAGTSGITHLKAWVGIFCGTIFWYLIVLLLFDRIDTLRGKTAVQTTESVSMRKTRFFLAWSLIFLSWIPSWLASYPGIYGYDSVLQMSWYRINNKHPLAHTLLMGFFINDVGRLLGSREAGFSVFCLLQMLVLSLAFALVYRFMVRAGIPKAVRIVILLLYMFLPFNAVMSFSNTKDIFFTAFMTMLTVLFAELAIMPDQTVSRKKIAVWILVMYLIILFRNQAVYICILAIIFGIFLFHGKNKVLIAVIGIISCVLFFATQAGFRHLPGYWERETRQEKLSVPIMQLSRVRTNPDIHLTVDENRQIGTYIPDYKTYPAFCGLSDSMKNTFNVELYKKDPGKFWSLWLRVGKQYPGEYFDAAARLNMGFWYPDMNFRDPKAYHPYWEYYNTCQEWPKWMHKEARKPDPGWILLDRKTPAGLQWLSDLHGRLAYHNSYQKVPVISMLFSLGFYTWILLFAIAYFIYRKEYKKLFPAALPFLLLLTCLLGPVVLFRYGYPIVAGIPVMLALMFQRESLKIACSSRK